MIDVTVFWAKNCILVSIDSLFLSLILSRFDSISLIKRCRKERSNNKIITSIDISCPHCNWSYSELTDKINFVMFTYSIGFQLIKLGFTLPLNINLVSNGFCFFFILSLVLSLKLFFAKNEKMESFVICGENKKILLYH